MLEVTITFQSVCLLPVAFYYVQVQDLNSQVQDIDQRMKRLDTLSSDNLSTTSNTLQAVQDLRSEVHDCVVGQEKLWNTLASLEYKMSAILQRLTVMPYNPRLTSTSYQPHLPPVSCEPCQTADPRVSTATSDTTDEDNVVVE